MINKACVMIVEADILVRHPLAEYLRECGYRVIEAFNADEARQLLNARLASIDIVLADAHASGESGFALATWIRGNHPKVEVILAGSVAKAAEKTFAKTGQHCRSPTTISSSLTAFSVFSRLEIVAANESLTRKTLSRVTWAAHLCLHTWPRTTHLGRQTFQEGRAKANTRTLMSHSLKPPE
jgi:CheY-like chemotaxis protein